MSIFDIIINIFTVLPKDISNINGTTLIQAPLITAFFYFISRWFKAYILRLGLFLLGAIVLLEVFKGQSFLNRFDFYGGLGLMLPHIEIVGLTYLIVREKIFTIHYKTLAFLQVISRPFVWLYARIKYFYDFNKAKQESSSNNQEHTNFEYEKQEQQKQKKQYEQYKKDEQKQQQQKQYKEYSEKEREQAKQEQQRKQQEQTKKEEVNKHPRWDSFDPYIVLDIERTATFKEIKKKYRQLALIYHPDTKLDEDKRKSNEDIFKKINNAYEKLEKKYKG